MSEEVKEEVKQEETKTPEFTDVFPSPVAQEDKAQAKANEAAEKSRDAMLEGLGKQMSEITLANIQKLAPLDQYEIPEGSGIVYERQKITPKKLRELKIAQQKYNKDVKKMDDDDELRIDRDFQLTALKAETYLGMTEKQFEDTDIEYLNQVLQATELRTQGFRKR